MTITTCVPADPESKGGAEATVRIAKADLVPTDTNLLPAYGSFAELVEGCERFMAEVNARPHRVTRRPPIDMLTEEVQHLHCLPGTAYMAAFGETRRRARFDPEPVEHGSTLVVSPGTRGVIRRRKPSSARTQGAPIPDGIGTTEDEAMRRVCSRAKRIGSSRRDH